MEGGASVVPWHSSRGPPIEPHSTVHLHWGHCGWTVHCWRDRATPAVEWQNGDGRKEEPLGGVATSGLPVEEALFRPRWLGVARDDLFGESWKRVEGGWLLRVCMTFSGDFMGDKRRATFKVHSGGY